MNQTPGRLDAALQWARGRRATPPPREGYVYLIRAGDRYKIGQSVNPHRRFHALQQASPEPLALVCVVYAKRPTELEQRYHARFRDKRQRGEWFALSDADVTSFCRRGLHLQTGLPCQWDEC